MCICVLTTKKWRFCGYSFKNQYIFLTLQLIFLEFAICILRDAFCKNKIFYKIVTIKKGQFCISNHSVFLFVLYLDEVVHILIPDIYRHKAHKWVKVTLRVLFRALPQSWNYNNSLVVIIYSNWFSNRHAAIRPVIAS